MSAAGLMAGENSARVLSTPAIFWQCRILKSRSATVSQSVSRSSLVEMQKYKVEPTPKRLLPVEESVTLTPLL